MNAVPASVHSGLAAHSLQIRAGARELVRDLSLDFSAGEFVAILGRNGSGKTLTLHTLAGLRAPHTGSVTLDGASLAGQGRRTIARRLGLLMQDMEDSFATTAMESVLIGRHPHLALWQWEGAEDERLALAALTRLDLGDACERSTATLSGGEQRRVAIASLLAQEPQVYLLDEPTNHLDPHHQLAVLGLFRKLANEGRSVIATLHDPTLAARFADRVILLFGDGRWRAGPARELLTGATLSELYLTPITEVAAGDRRIFVSA
jgi:iron complex transport system ATP-binding protein